MISSHNANEPREPFTFGIPLIARASAHDWRRIDALFELTLRSVLAQSDRDFRVLVIGHDQPPCWRVLAQRDRRFRFVHADWPAGRPTAANDDSGCKKWRIKEIVGEEGGGLLMYLDADDLVGRGLVETARRLITARKLGGIIDKGFAIDFETLCAMPLPDRRLFDGGFHRLCGSSTVVRITPDSADPVRQDPHEALGSHHVWEEAAEEIGVELVRLPAPGGYLVNTDENHSETHGPFAEWRREFNRKLQSAGEPVDEKLATLFGLDLDLLQANAGRKAA